MIVSLVTARPRVPQEPELNLCYLRTFGFRLNLRLYTIRVELALECFSFREGYPLELAQQLIATDALTEEGNIIYDR